MSKKKNIAIIGLGNIGSYFYKYVNSKIDGEWKPSYTFVFKLSI